MPVSESSFDPEIEDYFRQAPHDVVLDIGPGEGKFGKMLRRIRPQARLIGVEIDAGYVEQYRLRELYDEVRVQDAALLMNDIEEAYSAVIIGDCIEHMRKSVGLDLLNFLVYRTKIVVLKFPVALPQNSWEGHASEAHVSIWSEHDFAGFDHLHVSEPSMRFCMIRGYLSDTAEWVPPALMRKFGFGDLDLFVKNDGKPITATQVDPFSRVRRGARWQMETLEARWLNLIAWELRSHLSAGDSFVFIDDNQYFWQKMAITDARRVVFNERNGQYWGAPAADQDAIDELERLRAAGARLVVFTWTAFWWLDYYRGFAAHLRSLYPCVIQNDRAVAFQLSGRP